jgi:glyoxylase-like metal-dependent hydrolase (beta-lactamase superfamily II)
LDERAFTEKFLRSYAKGEQVFLQGSTGQHMYVVKSGGVDILAGAAGQEERLATLGKGQIFGEMALVDRLPRSASAVATEDGTQLLEIDHAHFVYLVGQQPAFALFVQKALSLRLRGLPERSSLPPEVEPETPSAAPLAPRDLGDGLYQLRARCNCYLVRGTRKNLLIDTGLPWESGALEAQLGMLGLTPGDVHLVAVTHEHLDHIGGVAHFGRRAVVAAHALTANKIGMQDDFVLLSKSFRLRAEDYPIDLHLHHGTKLDLGGCTLMVMHTPGHTSGSCCYYDPDRRVLFTGDTIFAGGILGGIFPSGSISDYTLTLRQLAGLRLNRFLSGHGKPSTAPDEDLDKAVRASVRLLEDTRSLFQVFDSRAEFAEVSKAVSAYARGV